LQELLDVVDGIRRVELVLDLVRVEDRVERRVALPVHGDELAVFAQADRQPDPDSWTGAQHVVGYFHRDRVDIPLAEGVLPLPIEQSVRTLGQPLENVIGVGEEGVASCTDKQAAGAGFHGCSHLIETHWRPLYQHCAQWLTALGLAAGGVVRRCGLPAVLQLREREAERSVCQRISVVVDVEPVDRVWVEPGAFEKGIRVHDHHGPIAVTGCGKHEQVCEVKTGIAPWKLEGMLVVAGAKMVGHCGNLLMLQATPARDIALLLSFQPPRKPISAWFTSSACVASMPWGAP